MVITNVVYLLPTFECHCDGGVFRRLKQSLSTAKVLIKLINPCPNYIEELYPIDSGEGTGFKLDNRTYINRHSK
ncbi:hypothetical protein KAU33_06220, partial [Candidatus Dependentiae bacterium]|nr:hypothetical protein [Candidatus Dependentiae bacterium]